MLKLETTKPVRGYGLIVYDSPHGKTCGFQDHSPVLSPIAVERSGDTRKLRFAEMGRELRQLGDIFCADPTVAEFVRVVKQRWHHPLGGEIGIDAVAIDSSNGNHMPHVYAFVKPRLRRKIVAIKGDGGRRPFILRSKTMKKDPLWIVGVDSIKDTILNRVQHGGIFRFSKDLPEVWYEQFTGEQSIVKMDRGRPVRKWIPVPGRRNEALDCVVYAIAAKELVTINWPVRRGQLTSSGVPANDNAPPPAPKRRVRQSDWI